MSNYIFKISNYRKTPKLHLFNYRSKIRKNVINNNIKYKNKKQNPDEIYSQPVHEALVQRVIHDAKVQMDRTSAKNILEMYNPIKNLF